MGETGTRLSRARAGNGLMQEVMRELDRNTLAVGMIDDRLKDHSYSLKIIHDLLFQGHNGESVVTQLALQEQSGEALAEWKKTLIARFWQVTLALVVAGVLAALSILWRADAQVQALDHKVQVLEQQMRSKP